MLNKLVFFICAIVTMGSCILYANNVPANVKWHTNYDEAVKESKSDSKPLLLYFTGSDWCGWCTKLEDEALDTAEFADSAANKFIFVKLDYPLYVNQDIAIKDQNKQLQQKFDVRCFPTIIILDPKDNQQIGITGYRPGGGKPFASHLNRLVNDYADYKHKMSTLENKKLTCSELKHLYVKAKELHLPNDTIAIINRGINSEESLYFLVERYRFLAHTGKVHTKEAEDVRQRLALADPQNEHLTQYQVALIEFQANSEEMGKNSNPEQTTAPLVAYIDKFGDKDKDHLWRLKMIISQVYLDRNQMPDALKYAQESYDSAPPCAQQEIGRAIKNMRAHSHS